MEKFELIVGQVYWSIQLGKCKCVSDSEKTSRSFTFTHTLVKLRKDRRHNSRNAEIYTKDGKSGRGNKVDLHRSVFDKDPFIQIGNERANSQIKDV